MLRSPKFKLLSRDSGLNVRSLFIGLLQINRLNVSELVLLPAVFVEHVLLLELDLCFEKLPDLSSSSNNPSIVLFLLPWDDTDIAELEFAFCLYA